MVRAFNRLLLILMQSTEQDLRRQVQFLKAENEMLRSRLPKLVRCTPQEKAKLIQLGVPLGTAIYGLISIVDPNSFFRWIRKAKKIKPRQIRSRGRPRTSRNVKEIVLRIANETGWGYTRILGELKKLGITNISRTTVYNILKAHGYDPGPMRGVGTWDEFLKRHAKTLWACDYVHRRVMSAGRVRLGRVLVFINVTTRRVWASPATYKCSTEWRHNQVNAFCDSQSDRDYAPTIVLRDNDSCLGPPIDEAFERRGVRVIKLPVQAPNLNAYAERFIQTIQNECLDHFMIFGRRHFDYLVSEYVDYYNTQRPHQACGNLPLSGEWSTRAPPINSDEVHCSVRLGGLIRDYRHETL